MSFIANYLRWNWHGALSVLSGSLCLCLGIVVYLKDPRSRTNRTFFAFTLSSFMWIFSYGMLSLVRNPEDVFMYSRLAYLYGVPYIALNTYLFSCALTDRRPPKMLVPIAHVWAFVSMIPMLFFPSLIKNVPEFWWGRYPSWMTTWPSITHQVFLIIPFWWLALLSFINFAKGWKNAPTKPQRLQYKYLTIGFSFAYFGAADFLAASRVRIYPWGYITLTLFICMLAYTIVKHRAFNIQLALKRLTLVLGIYAVLFLIALPASYPLTKILLSNSRHDPPLIVLMLATAMGFLFSLGPLIYARFVRSAFWLKGHSAAGLVHEMRSPLSAIQSASEFVRDSLQRTDVERESALEYVDMIEKNADRLDAFVKDLLNVAREESMPADLQLSRVQLREVFKPVIERYEPLFAQKKIPLAYSITDATVRVDQTRMHQVLSNLLSNALKFTDEGEVRIDAVQRDGEILFSVQDTGKGINQRQLEKVFTRFYQASPGTKGTGIGLTIAKTWVEAHGGKIWAESDGEGRGTKISFTVPAA